MLKYSMFITLSIILLIATCSDATAEETVRIQFKKVYVGDEGSSDQVTCPISTKPGKDKKNKYCKQGGKYQADAACVEGTSVKGTDIIFESKTKGGAAGDFTIIAKTGQPFPFTNCRKQGMTTTKCTFVDNVAKGVYSYTIQAASPCELDPRIIISDEQVDLTDKDKKKKH